MNKRKGDDISEDLWLKQLSDGDEKAYKRLFDQYYSSMVMFARSFLKNDVLVEDVVQDVIYDFWMQRQSLSKVISIKAWLYAAVRNRCLNDLEHDKVVRKYLDKVKLVDNEFILQQMIEEEVYLSLKNSIDALPGKIKEVYKLILVGKNNKEIAFLLNLSEDAVKSYRKRGKQILKISLGNLWTLVVFYFPFL
ncbi:MAG: sigma-70 family RNA polymerase sigma factor [Odoribacter sp.]|nr:sigma-70 family RNA polymerase sigma factor [Odoribacter sp.]MDY3033668.1 sigma-70 family RNA polymerase sigma factor [Odoribacter sp.]